jgi:3D (Asp-Asp-Asp) domain-containing protein
MDVRMCGSEAWPNVRALHLLVLSLLLTFSVAASAETIPATLATTPADIKYLGASSVLYPTALEACASVITTSSIGSNIGTNPTLGSPRNGGTLFPCYGDYGDLVHYAVINISVMGKCPTDGGYNYSEGKLTCQTYTCPSQDWTLSGDKCTRPDTLVLSVKPSPPIIPDASRVQNRHVLTQSDLALNLQKGKEPASGITVNLESSRKELDVVNGQSAPTDAHGNATAEISTRNQPGTSVIRASDTINIKTISPGVVNWLPADYESEFLVTCYNIAVEADAPAQPTTDSVCGLPKRAYRSAFLRDVKMQGSGVATNGQYVHYQGKGCYNLDTCARTSNGSCATVGTTIAVDPTIIPRGSKVNVKLLGGRTAQDGGGWIKGYHIDNYMGAARAACLSFGKQHSAITFENY